MSSRSNTDSPSVLVKTIAQFWLEQVCFSPSKKYFKTNLNVELKLEADIEKWNDYDNMTSFQDFVENSYRRVKNNKSFDDINAITKCLECREHAFNAWLIDRYLNGYYLLYKKILRFERLD